MKHLVENAADEVEVSNAAETIKRKTLSEREDFRYILKSPQGRRVLWRILGHCKVFESIYHGSSLIHYNAGKQDVGHFLLSEIINTDEMALIKMMQESKEEN